MTHFPATFEVRHPRFNPNPITAYFQADCKALIEMWHPRLWIYGHNHWGAETLIGQTQLVSDQLGYPSEAGMVPMFRSDWMIEID